MPSLPSQDYTSLPPIVSARILSGRPAALPPLSKRMTGVQKAGLAFQRAVLRHVRQQSCGPYPIAEPWFSYARQGEDSRLHHFCSPDMLLLEHLVHLRATIIECKLSYRPEAWSKLYNLYLPVISISEGIQWNRIALIQAYKHSAVTPNTPIYENFEEIQGALRDHTTSASGLPFIASLHLPHL